MPHQKWLMYNSLFPNLSTQYLILNKNLNENDDVGDNDYKFFFKKTGKK